jgi:hypothetical protein
MDEMPKEILDAVHRQKEVHEALEARLGKHKAGILQSAAGTILLIDLMKHKLIPTLPSGELMEGVRNAAMTLVLDEILGQTVKIYLASGLTGNETKEEAKACTDRLGDELKAHVAVLKKFSQVRVG